MATKRPPIGNRIAPARFILFVVLLVAGSAVGWSFLGWRQGIMAGFDGAAIVFLLACTPLLNDKPERMRSIASENDANRAVLLLVTLLVSLVILVAIAAELSQKGSVKGGGVTLILTTLVLSWVFSNFVFTLHYAHMFYRADDDAGGDQGGIKFPECDEPDYWDFVYFAFCLGMTFQTSDVDITSRRIRKAVTFHCLAAFVFNLGVIAFSINVLGGG